MDSSELFLYIGQSAEDIPEDVTHVRVDPSVKEIGEYAFRSRRHLRNVELLEGLEQIAPGAFRECTSLEHINIPSTVKTIWHEAFADCTQLMNVELHEGLETFGTTVFWGCESLTSIAIPSTVRYIGWGAFIGCNHLMNLELCEGELKRIDEGAFQGFSSLERICIPSTVKEIGERAFRCCDSLEVIEFCDEVEQFVDEVPLLWWNHGVSEASLRTYSFLAQHNIPARLDTIKAQSLKNNIHNMLQRIPEMRISWYEYFDSIASRLENYEYLQDVAPFLELALWKAKIMEQTKGNIINIKNGMKLMCRTNSFSMFAVIFPNVISFLVGV